MSLETGFLQALFHQLHGANTGQRIQVAVYSNNVSSCTGDRLTPSGFATKAWCHLRFCVCIPALTIKLNTEVIASQFDNDHSQKQKKSQFHNVSWTFSILLFQEDTYTASPLWLSLIFQAVLSTSQETFKHHIIKDKCTSFHQPDSTLPGWDSIFISMWGDAQCWGHWFVAGLQHLHGPHSLVDMLKELQNKNLKGWWNISV